MQLELSLVIPAYNEVQRLPPYLEAVERHLSQRYRDRYEVVIVDDGSTDGMDAMLRGLSKTWSQLRLVQHQQNQGKGAAIKTGVLAASGSLVLFADADGATPITEEESLSLAIERGADVAVGSRLQRAEGIARTRNWCRGLCGRAFSRLVQYLFQIPVRDTQCGFKMFRREAGLSLIPACRQTGYLLDVEFLALAQRHGYEIAEVPVSWQEVPGSKLRLFRDGYRMVSGLWSIRATVRALPAEVGTRRAITVPPADSLGVCRLD